MLIQKGGMLVVVLGLLPQQHQVVLVVQVELDMDLMVQMF